MLANIGIKIYNMRSYMFYFNGKKIERVGFLGLGKSNLGVYSYLSLHHAFDVTVRSREPVDTSVFGKCRIHFGGDMLKNIDEDILFLSPSARREVPEILSAKERGVILSSDAELFFASTAADIYSVTGSDGKSTTAYLTARMLEASYAAALPCGNIGEAMAPHLDDPAGAAYVAELSSFQLNYFKPHSKRSIITNISENHLNWHSSFSEYISAKSNVLDFTDERVCNYDSEIVRELVREYPLFAAFSTTLSENALKSQITAEIYITLSDGKIIANGKQILDTAKIKVGGSHNIKNFMAAIAMSYGRCTASDISSIAESFGGLRHRCELVAVIDGVRYYDSSIDSSPKRCAATLGMMKERVIIILGGQAKGLDFRELIPALREKAKAIILTGDTADELYKVISESDIRELNIPVTRIYDFYEAVRFSVKAARPGDTVLLSPAATSYDRFSNFEERGDAFAKEIKKTE